MKGIRVSAITTRSSQQKHKSLFCELSKQYAAFAAEAGIEVLAYHDPELPLFSKLTETAQLEILHSLKTCVQICEDTTARGKSVNDTASLLWSAVKAFNLRPPSDFFSKVTNDSVIEMHSSQGIQLFRNFNFYRYCSYSIEELYAEPWSILFSRDAQTVELMLDFLKSIYIGSCQSTADPRIPAYRAKELFSRRLYEIEVHWTWGAPLFESGSGRPVASIAIETARLVTPSTDVHVPTHI